MYVFPAGGICTMCSKICDEDETQGSTFLTDVWLISTQNWITESYWKFNLKKIGRRIGITKKVVLGFAWRVEDYKSWRWLVMCAGLWLDGTWEHVCRPQPPPATSHTHTYPQQFFKFQTWQMTVVYYKVDYLPGGVRIWFRPNCRVGVFGDMANLSSEIG